MEFSEISTFEVFLKMHLHLGISVIIPTFNESKRIGKLIDHLFANTDDNLVEVIVADGGSTDGTTDIVSRSKATLISVPQKGRAIQMNYGAMNSKGRILYFLHADGWPPPTYLQDIALAVDQGHLAGSYRFQFDSGRRLLGINSWFTKFGALFCRGGDQSMFVTKAAFNDIGQFDESCVIMEDFDFFIRWRKEHDFYVIPKEIIVSDRKYKTNSYMRVQVANLIAFTMFKRGMSKQRIKSVYEGMLDLSFK